MNKVIVERKPIKNMYLRVKRNGEIKVTAPSFVSDVQIETFLKSKKEWIEKHKKDAVIKNFVTGETHMVLGKEYILRIEKSSKNEVQLKDNYLILKVKNYENREKVLNEWYRKILLTQLEILVPLCEKNTGAYVSEWRIKNMKSRWGTCNIKDKRIWLNLKLAEKDIDCISYVITHELVHLYEPGHGMAFKALMDKYYPSWRDTRKRLKETYGDSDIR